jgi:hypothetical protein
MLALSSVNIGRSLFEEVDMTRRYLFLMIALLALAALACNAPGLGQDTPAEETESGGAPAGEQQAAEEQPAGGPVGQPAGEAAAGEAAVAAEQPTGGPAGQPSAYPIGMRTGLASLNSYRLIMKMVNNGPTPQDISETHTEVQFNGDNDARYMRVENVESTADYPETYISVEETYQVGLQSCSVSTYDGETEVAPSDLSPLAHDMALATTNLFDISVSPENPTFVSAESMNGIPSNHYTFQITGLGDYSGQEVTQAGGDYWVAQDGQYLVKYNLVLEVRSAPEGDPAAEVMYSEYAFDLLEANQPQSIAMPADCAP